MKQRKWRLLGFDHMEKNKKRTSQISSNNFGMNSKYLTAKKHYIRKYATTYTPQKMKLGQMKFNLENTFYTHENSPSCGDLP